MVWCDTCKDERFYALVKVIKEEIKHKKKLMRQKFENKNFLKIEIRVLEDLLNAAKNLALLSKEEADKLWEKGYLFGIK